MSSTEQNKQNVLGVDPTLAAIEGLGVSSEEALRLFTRYCAGPHAVHPDKPTEPSPHSVLPVRPRENAIITATLVEFTFEQVVAGEFTN